MQIGAESRNKIIILAVLGVIVLVLLPRFFSGGSPTPAAPVATVASASTPRPAVIPGQSRRKWPPPSKSRPAASLDPSLRFDLLKRSEDQDYEGGKRNIFESRAADIPEPVIDVRKNPPNLTPPAPVVPQLPAIPLKFFGFATQQGQAKRVFLSSGDDVFVGKEGEVINRRYRIVKINNTSVEIEDVLNNNKQIIQLTAG